MKKISFYFSVFFIGFFVIFAVDEGKEERIQDINALNLSVKSQDIKSSVAVKPDLNFGKFPLYFIFNKGQVNEKAMFYAKTSSYTLWLTKEGLVFDSLKKVKVKAEVEEKKGVWEKLSHSTKIERDVSRFIFLNSNKNPEMVPVEESKLRVNYFIGNDKSKWYCDVPTTQAVLYKNLYKDIDLKVYGIDKQIEYDWIVKPKGDPKEIMFEYKNVKGTRIDDEGNLLIETDFGELMHKRPVSYQEIRMEHGAWGMEEKIDVEVKFKKIGENTYGFEVGEYDKSCELVIDPAAIGYSTYLGGMGDDYGIGIAVDNNGNAYVTGSTSSTNFPTLDTYEANQPGEDFFVTKIDTTQKGALSLIYSIYMGGDGRDISRGISIDSNGYAYITGWTDSTDLTTVNPYQTDQPGGDVFVTKIDTTQNGASGLIYSTYLGGGGHDYGYDIAVDTSGNAYVTGYTESTDFPILNQFQLDQKSRDSFLVKIDTTQKGASSLVYSTYLGGGDEDYGGGIAVEKCGYVYVTGSTYSTDFPILNQYQADQGSLDVFIAKIDTTLSGVSSLIYSTYLGGSREDYGIDIAVDSSGYVYVTGSTLSMDFPILASYCNTKGNDYDAFITKIDMTQKGISGLIYSTYLGGEGIDYGYGIAVDSSGNAYVTGRTFSTDFPTQYPYQTDQAGEDAFVTKIDTAQKGTSSFIYSTYLGGEGSEAGHGIAVDNSGNVYVCGGTNSSDFPTLNQYQTDQGGRDAFITKIMPCTGSPQIELNRTYLNFAAVIGGPQTGSQTISIGSIGGCALRWSAYPDETWIQVSPDSGTGSGLVAVSVDTTGLAVGSYTGTITIEDPSASNSPQIVSVILTIYSSGGIGTSNVPFGHFSTPAEGAIVRSSIPVTGWVLDDIGVESVKIYRYEAGAYVYIGGAVFVEGARPDVELAYPTYPFNYRAGWGYMLLTNFLPNKGNGIFTLYAFATDKEGNVTILGTKTITCDNVNAVKPFGAIDTPAQGGTTSGGNYSNFGWVLTPMPNAIPTDGSTINVYVDGVNLGNPTYNIYREDIATLFPNYANSEGAVGHFSLNTTAYNNGMHTIFWITEDDAGNTDGIGSRYFSIQNSGAAGVGNSIVAFNVQRSMFNVNHGRIPVDYSHPVRIKKGYNPGTEPEEIYPDDKGFITIEIKELQPLVIRLLPEGSKEETRSAPLLSEPLLVWSGYQKVGSQLRPLPIGSTFDKARSVFYWHPGPGFMGEYRFIFIKKGQDGEYKKKKIKVEITPKL